MSRRAVKTLEDMRANPRDWRIDDLETVARVFSISVREPSGSHVLFSHPQLREALNVPARRPIKAVYVWQFVRLVDRVRLR
mgnify:CR=1 FL=1